MATNPSVTRVHILATGGTISSKGADTLKTTGYTASTIGVQSLIDAVPEITRFAEISGEQVTNVLSHCLTHDIWLQLARRCNELFASDQADGIVITHGTNTLEETAWFLNLTVKSEKPVIVTGAMRPATAISADGPANLLQSVIIAASPHSKNQGVLVVLNNEIHSAKGVTKTNTSSLQTFQSPDSGPIGRVHESAVHFFCRPTQHNASQNEFDSATIGPLPRVDILYGYLGDDDLQLQAALAAGAKGVVVAATGSGMISDHLQTGLSNASKQGIIVVRSSRCGSGPVVPVPNDDIHGFIAAGTLNPQKARILLLLALAKGYNDVKEIRRLFEAY